MHKKTVILKKADQNDGFSNYFKILIIFIELMNPIV